MAQRGPLEANTPGYGCLPHLDTTVIRVSAAPGIAAKARGLGPYRHTDQLQGQFHGERLDAYSEQGGKVQGSQGPRAPQ